MSARKYPHYSSQRFVWEIESEAKNPSKIRPVSWAGDRAESPLLGSLRDYVSFIHNFVRIYRLELSHRLELGQMGSRAKRTAQNEMQRELDSIFACEIRRGFQSRMGGTRMSLPLLEGLPRAFGHMIREYGILERLLSEDIKKTLGLMERVAGETPDKYFYKHREYKDLMIDLQRWFLVE